MTVSERLPEPIGDPRHAAGPMADRIGDDLLENRTARLVEEGLAANTRLAYARDFAVYATWCEATGRPLLPATAATLANYVAHLAAQQYAPSTIDRALACILAAHDHAQLSKPATTAARLALRAYRRDRAQQGHRPRKSPPITVDRLRAMIDALPADTPTGRRDRAILVLGFAIMARRSELTDVDLDDLTFTTEGLELYVPFSKTDQDASGETVAIPYGQHPRTCPVRVTHAWLTDLTDAAITTGPLFRPIDRHGRIAHHTHPAAGRGRRERLTPQTINLIVKRAAAAAALEHADTYTAHGLRAGGATSAAKAGAPMSAITRHGRWADGSPVVAGYIRQADKWTDNPLHGIGL
ncbi:tyrosine-type recombinase/integrase [Nonomuraea sp. NBC_01738]|uniref:tyrosine-type recombinase/integrase n=1 Tax=Nonomuraea sp. NBC_01738 TaxID=2976003 RepID=UPI002E103DFB|nr:tyrosine-type recombinase/integrase [Nonomuraea sp. NBC_01738]